jgi:hypothetical protein
MSKPPRGIILQKIKNSSNINIIVIVNRLKTNAFDAGFLLFVSSIKNNPQIVLNYLCFIILHAFNLKIKLFFTIYPQFFIKREKSLPY